MFFSVCFVLIVLCACYRMFIIHSTHKGGRHASRMRKCTQRMEEEDVVPRCRGGTKGRHADVEPNVEHQPDQHEQEYMEDVVEVQHMEEQDLEEELQAMDEDMEDVQPQRRQRRKSRVVDPEPLDDYLGGPHDIGLLWRYHVHVAKKAADGEVFINVKLTLICC